MEQVMLSLKIPQTPTYAWTLGMYFTSSALYALPYYANRSDPALLICLITPGTDISSQPP